MQITLDIVDLLQLHEVWSRRPVVTAFTRLEGRQTALPSQLDFNVDQLLPRLARLKRSPVWLLNKANLTTDPGRIPMRDLSEAYLTELYPEADSGAEVRQSLFHSAYSRFIITHYSGDVEWTGQLFRAIAQVRGVDASQCLDYQSLPQEGSSEWIPADITDEIRSLDSRYKISEPNLPAAYVISDEFWPLLVKTTEDEIEAAAQLHCSDKDSDCIAQARESLTMLVEVAFAWNRSPSVVGLCYQVPS